MPIGYVVQAHGRLGAVLRQARGNHELEARGPSARLGQLLPHLTTTTSESPNGTPLTVRMPYLLVCLRRHGLRWSATGTSFRPTARSWCCQSSSRAGRRGGCRPSAPPPARCVPARTRGCVCVECPTLVSGSGVFGAWCQYLAQYLSCGIQYTFYSTALVTTLRSLQYFFIKI